LLLCDVARESADELLAALRGLGLAERGAIGMTDSGLVLSRAAERAEAEAPGAGADAVLWESVADLTRSESTLNITYLLFLSVATMLAACGVMMDNAILIVGAMAVGPEFGPLAGICLALVLRRGRELVRSLLALVLGFLVAIALTWMFSLVMDDLGLFTRERFDGPRPATSFIWQPDTFSVVVAMLAGVAGMLSLTSARSAVLVGVAISVTTVPAAANAAVALAYSEVYQGWGSFVQLGVNLGGIVFAGTLTLLGQRLILARTGLGGARVSPPPETG
jgi:uncharacterized hydrophobic protein (TIGR00271 family)